MRDVHANLCGAEDALVDEVHETEVLEEVVLNGRSGQEDAALALEGHQRLVRLILRVLQTVTLKSKRTTQFWMPSGSLSLYLRLSFGFKRGRQK